MSWLALESNQPPIHWVLYSFPGLMRPGHETEHSPPPTVEVKNEWNYTSTPPVCLMARTVTRLVFICMPSYVFTDSEYSTESHSVDVHWLRLKCDGTRAETRFRISEKRTSPFKSAGPRAEVCVSAVGMLDTPCSDAVWRVLATHSIRQFPLHFPSRASPCAITFQLDSSTVRYGLFFWSWSEDGISFNIL